MSSRRPSFFQFPAIFSPNSSSSSSVGVPCFTVKRNNVLCHCFKVAHNIIEGFLSLVYLTITATTVTPNVPKVLTFQALTFLQLFGEFLFLGIFFLSSCAQLFIITIPNIFPVNFNYKDHSWFPHTVGIFIFMLLVTISMTILHQVNGMDIK